jgi:hypothetical protein
MSWSTTNTKLAAAYAGLGFPVTTRDTVIIERSRKEDIRFHIDEKTLDRPQVLYSRHLHQLYVDGTLAEKDPTHPLLTGYAACENMDALQLILHRGTAHELAFEKGLWKYRAGTWSHPILLQPAQHGTKDMPLAAAVTLAGVPMIGHDGTAPRHRLLFPDDYLQPPSLPISKSPTLPVADLFTRRGTDPYPHALQLGLTHPDHPVVHGYNAARAYARFLGEIKHRQILAKDPTSARRVLIPENPSPQLQDDIRRFFRIP